jgi:hypothetical protein
MEITFETQATVYGTSGMNIGTYVVWERIPGQMYGEGQGTFFTMDGQGAIWNGSGIGQFREDGSIAFAAAVAFQAGQGALERLNHVLVLVEHTTDMENNAHSTLHEWKA